MFDAEKIISEAKTKYSTFKILADSGEGFAQTARSLIIANALTGGQDDDYSQLVAAQYGSDKLTPDTFALLSNYFYPFKMKSDLYNLLEIIIVLNGYARTGAARVHLRNLSENQRHPKSREEMLLSFIHYGMIPEVASLNLSSLDKLRNALGYKQCILELAQGRAHNQTLESVMHKHPLFEYGEDEKRIAFAGSLCELIGLASTPSGSVVISDSTASDLLFFSNDSILDEIAQRLFERDQPGLKL